MNTGSLLISITFALTIWHVFCLFRGARCYFGGEHLHVIVCHVFTLVEGAFDSFILWSDHLSIGCKTWEGGESEWSKHQLDYSSPHLVKLAKFFIQKVLLTWWWCRCNTGLDSVRHGEPLHWRVLLLCLAVSMETEKYKLGFGKQNSSLSFGFSRQGSPQRIICFH